MRVPAPRGIELIAKLTQSACPTPDSAHLATYFGHVEQRPRIRTTQPDGPSESTIAAPAPAAVYRAAPVRGPRPAPPAVAALSRFPNPRLTGLGGGIFSAVVMFLVGCADWLLFDGGPLMYGLLFLPVAALTALWVRPADLVTAPISVPISFAFGTLPIAGAPVGPAAASSP